MLFHNQRARGAVGALVLALSGSAGGETGVNLISNPGADDGAGGNGSTIIAAPGWTPSGSATVVSWTAGGGFPAPSDPGPQDRASNFFSGGPSLPTSSQVQNIDVAGDSAAIDAGTLGFTLSAYLGGFSSQRDQAELRVDFVGSASQTLGSALLEAVTPEERSNQTGMLLRTHSGLVPPGTRTVRLSLGFIRFDGSYNDGYADSLSLVLTPPAACVGDLNEDGVVNTADLVRLLLRFGQSVPAGSPEDLNGDGVVNTVDLTRLLVRFGAVCA